jgi:hypothetical protein
VRQAANGLRRLDQGQRGPGLAARALAQAERVEDSLLAEWSLSQPSLEGRTQRAARSAAEVFRHAASPGVGPDGAASRGVRAGGTQADGPDGALSDAVLAALLAGEA